jgi:preprotein translocase subunit SecD
VLRVVGLIWIVLASAVACTSVTVAPTNCWVGFRGEYRLATPDGADSGAAAVEEAARIIDARIARIGFAQFGVRFRSDGVIEVELPASADQIDVHALILPTGDLAFVPIPEGVSAAVGDPIPADLQPLFGRDGLKEVRPGADQLGMAGLDIELTPGASAVFADYTRRNVGRQVAIAIDGVIHSAPVIQQPIEDGRAQISSIDADDANRLAVILSLPRLPGVLTELTFTGVDPPPGCVAIPS